MIRRHLSPQRPERGAREPSADRLDLDRDAVATIAFLQRTSGNAAVSGLLERLERPPAPAPARSLSRYESGEHAMFGGNEKRFTIKGVGTITQGDLYALADLYGTPEDVLKADHHELKTLIELIHRDRKFYETGKGKPVGHEEWEKATENRKGFGEKSYMELAEQNEPHFAAPKAGGTGQDHKTEWERLHSQALDEAQKAVFGDKKVSPQAKFLNGFAAHFLTDAFSAGHIVAKSDVMAAARAFWTTLVNAGTATNFTDAVAKRVLGDAGAKRKLAEYELTVERAGGYVKIQGDFTQAKFAQLLNLIANFEQDRFLNAFAKIVHDELNETGIEVENMGGDPPWKLPGDKTLRSSPDTIRIAKKAIAQSERNLALAATTRGPLNYGQMFFEVWKFVPRPSATAAKDIQATIDTFADAAKPAAVDEFVKLTIRELSIALEVLESGGYAKKKPRSRRRTRSPRAVPAGTP